MDIDIPTLPTDLDILTRPTYFELLTRPKDLSYSHNQLNFQIKNEKEHKPEVNHDPEPSLSDLLETSSSESRAKKKKSKKKQKRRKQTRL